MRSWIWMVVTALSLALLTSGCGKSDTPSEQKADPDKSIPVKGGKDRGMPPLPP